MAILSKIEKGEWEWIGSEVLLDEIEQIPDANKLSRAKLLSTFRQKVRIGDAEVKRAKELQREGSQVFDALHIACAETARVDALLTTDDRLLKLAQRLSNKLKARIENPLLWVEEMI